MEVARAACDPEVVMAGCDPEVGRGACAPAEVRAPCDPEEVEAACDPEVVTAACDPEVAKAVCNPEVVRTACDIKDEAFSQEKSIEKPTEENLTVRSSQDASKETTVVIKAEPLDGDTELIECTSSDLKNLKCDLEHSESIALDPKLLMYDLPAVCTLPAGSIPLGPLIYDGFEGNNGQQKLHRCNACDKVFKKDLDFVLHKCSARQQVSESEHQWEDAGHLPNALDPDRQIFECTKCRLLFNEISELKDHKCLGFLNEPEREERKKRRMIRVGGERAAAVKAKCKLHKIVSDLEERKPIKIKIKKSSVIDVLQQNIKKEGPTRKVGRPRKQKAADIQVQNQQKVQDRKENVSDKNAVVGVIKVKKKRGRPPKIKPLVLNLNIVKQEIVDNNEICETTQDKSNDEQTTVENSNSDISTNVHGHEKGILQPVFDQNSEVAYKCEDDTYANEDNNDDDNDDDGDDAHDQEYIPPTFAQSESNNLDDAVKPLKKRKPRNSTKVKLRKPRKPRDPTELKRPRASRRTNPADLICRFCGKKCRKPYELRVHERLHTNDKPFRCQMPNCTKAYVSNSMLNKHIREAHIAANLKCKECNIGFSCKELLKEHCEQFNHNIQWPYPCDQCDKSYPKRKMLEEHLMTHRGIKPFPCTMPGCTVAFNTRVSLHQHIRTHTGDRRFSCDICGQRFLTRHLLNAHKMNHTGERPHLCDICGKGFKLAAQLRHHADVHRKEKPYMCDTCGKKFKWQYNMLNHAKSHSEPNDKPKTPRFFCSVCGKGYFHKSGLEYHERTHTGERPYQCRRCGKKFRHNAHLQKHLNKVHHLTMNLKPLDDEDIPEKKRGSRDISTIKPFPCNLCSKEFKQKVGLVKHMRIFHKMTYDGQPLPDVVLANEIESQPVSTEQIGRILDEREIGILADPVPRDSVLRYHTLDVAAAHSVLDPYHSARLPQGQQTYTLEAMTTTNTLLASQARPSDTRNTYIYSTDYLTAMNMPHGLMNIPTNFNIRPMLSEDEVTSLQ